MFTIREFVSLYVTKGGINMIIDYVIKIQNTDSEPIIEMVERFNPLLKKYAKRLYYEDAYNDLVADFIELLLNIDLEKIRIKEDGGMVSYIAKSIHSCYIKRLKKIRQACNVVIYSELSEKESYYIELLTATKDTYINIDLDFLRKTLTVQEFYIIKRIYYDMYSATEIAKILGVSRQAVNQMKNRTHKKIKHVLDDMY